tara:strand:+ start:931 stop:1146 length:216 start_codon:yes stop_codon:yes gene_type:complete
VKVGDFIQSSAFLDQSGIILETDVISNQPDNETWFLVHWFTVMPDHSMRKNRSEWLRRYEIEPRDLTDVPQ